MFSFQSLSKTELISKRRQLVIGDGLEEVDVLFGSATKSLSHSFRNRLAPISCVISLLLFTAHIGAQTVVTYGFEDGTADGWTSFNGASTPVATNAAEPADDNRLRWCRWPLNIGEQSSLAGRDIHDHRLCPAHAWRDRD